MRKQIKEELKTLKDIIKKAKKEDELSFAGYTGYYLKAEAIKWIKEINEQTKGCKCETCGMAYINNKYFWYQTTEWIKHFFNLTEEEIK